jgi:membrane-associated phospholipid phosphatase
VDDGLAVWLNRLARRRPGLQVVVGESAKNLAAVEVGLMLLLAARGRRGSALRMLAAVGLVYAASEGLGRAWTRQRPFARLTEVQSLAWHTPDRSFPSRHVASGLAMAAIGGREHPHLGLLMTCVAWALGLTRVAAGLHYPTDVAAGAVLGLAIGRYARRQ